MQKPHVLVAVCMLLASSANAQERLGLVQGTWEACTAALGELKQAGTRASSENKTSGQLAGYYSHKITVEQDKCLRFVDAPLTAFVEVVEGYLSLGIDGRAFDLSLQARARFGEVAALEILIAKLYYKRGDFERAVPLLEKVLADKPNEPDANRLLGVRYYRTGDLKRAIPRLRAAAQERPNEFEVAAALGDACLQTQELDCAAYYLARASELKPSDVLLAVKVGDLFRSRNELGMAIDAYTRALAVEPTRIDARLGLGRSMAAADLLESASAELVAAARLDSGSVPAAVEASRVLRRLGREPLGIELVRKVLVTRPNAPEAHLELALGLNALGRSSEVTQLYGALGPTLRNDDRILSAHGDALLALGRHKEALAAYENALTRRPGTPQYTVRVARALARVDKHDAALALLLGALAQQDAAVVSEYVRLNLELASRKSPALAHRLLAEAYTKVPDSVDLRLAYVASAAAIGELERATELLATVGDGPRARMVKAYVAYSANEPTAIDTIRQAQQSDVDGMSGLLLAAAELRAGRFAAAVESARKSRSPQAAAWIDAALSRMALQQFSGKDYSAARASALLGESEWFKAAERVADLALGQTKAASSTQDGSALGVVLAAVAQPDPQLALDILKSAPASPMVNDLRAQIQAHLAKKLYDGGRVQDAVRVMTAARRTEAIDDPAYFNQLVLTNLKDAGAAARALGPWVDQNVPEALFNMACAVDKSGGEQLRVISLLQKVANSGSPLAPDAHRLLTLKQSLYP